MACSAVRSPLILNPTVRHYAAAAAAQCSASATPEIQVLDNKVTVATIDNNNPVSQISILFRAGSRYETYDTQGVSHHLRVAAGLTTTRSSTFAITRNIQQLGANILATVDRESLAYTLQVTRDNLAHALGFLEDVATRPVFHPWELSDQLPRLRYELSTIPEFTRVIELLHKAAYRKGLGYSLYSPKRQVGKINSETLKHFVNTFCTAPRCAVVATGVPFSEVSAFANNLSLSCNGTVDEPAKYYGGEVRKERSSALANVAVAVEGSGLDKEKDAIAFAVLQAAAGTGPRVKWGGSTSPLYKIAHSAAGTVPFAISALNASYSDSGLFGFVLSAPGDIAGAITKAASAWLRSPKLTDADITRGKVELKTAVYYSADNSSELLESLGHQALLKHRVYNPSTIAAEIDKVSVSDVKALCGKLSSGKVSMAAIGDLRTVPYVDQLS